jgi:hypothetical protein
VRGAPCQTEIQHFHAVLRDHDIGGLQIAMRGVLVVRGGKCTGDLSAVAEDVADRKRALPDAGCHGFALHQFHHHVARTDIVERADMGMIQ